MEWTKAEKEFVDGARVMRLATVGIDGQPHNVAVCPVLRRGRVYFASEVEATKVRNIRARPNVAVVFDDYSENWRNLRGVMVVGDARIVAKRMFSSLRKELYAKFPQYKSEAPLDAKDSVIVEVTPVRKFSWGFEG